MSTSVDRENSFLTHRVEMLSRRVAELEHLLADSAHRESKLEIEREDVLISALKTIASGTVLAYLVAEEALKVVKVKV